MTNNELNTLKRKIAEALGWDLRDFDLTRAGTKGGRPYWNAERYDAPRGKNYYAFSAFDANDIYDLHEVRF